METDLEGRLARLYLSQNRPLLPVYEAISNALYAVEERPAAQHRVTLTIDRLLALGTLEEGELGEGMIRGFTITDTGIGFTDRHYTSFNTLDSQLKLPEGGKGVGRLFWLVAFADASVESEYEEGGTWYRRTFAFTRRDGGVSTHQRVTIPAPASGHRTVVRLRGMQRQYREKVPRLAETVGRHVIEHFLSYFVLGTVPTIVIEDPAREQAVVLNELFRRAFDPQVDTAMFELGTSRFNVSHVLVRGSTDLPHQVLLTANHRAVKAVKVGSSVPHLDEPIIDPQGHAVTYLGCVSGPLLSEHVDQARGTFTLPQDGDLNGGDAVTLDAVQRAAKHAAATFLAPLTEDRRQRALERAEKAIANTLPHLRPVLTNRRTEVEALPTTLGPDAYRDELEKIHLGWKLETSREAAKTIGAIADKPEMLPQLRARARSALEGLAQVSVSELAEYLIYRRLVLQHMQTLLGPTDGKLPAEEDLHQVIFPLRQTSDDVDEETHNLWLLDEMLVYHHYLASDLAFSRQRGAPVGVEGEARADILVYNVPMALADGPTGEAPITIVEFKRPEKKAHGKRNPIEQVFDYIDRIRDGKAKTPTGVTIQVNPKTARFYCYIIAHLDKTMVLECSRRSFKRTPDGGGFYGYVEDYNAWFEVKSWQKVVQDASRRHQAFWRRLNIDRAPPLP